MLQTEDDLPALGTISDLRDDGYDGKKNNGFDSDDGDLKEYVRLPP